MANELTDPQARRERIAELRGLIWKQWPYPDVSEELADAYEHIEELEKALRNLTDEVAANAYSPGCEHMGPLVLDARTALKGKL